VADGLRNVEQAAAWLGIPKKTLQGFVTARLVPFTFVGKHVRFSQEHLDAIVEAGDQPVIAAPTRLQVVTAKSGKRRATGPRPPAGPSTPPPPPGPSTPSKGVAA